MESWQKTQLLLYLVKRLVKATASTKKLICSLSMNNKVVAKMSTWLWQWT